MYLKICNGRLIPFFIRKREWNYLRLIWTADSMFLKSVLVKRNNSLKMSMESFNSFRDTEGIFSSFSSLFSSSSGMQFLWVIWCVTCYTISSSMISSHMDSSMSWLMACVNSSLLVDWCLYFTWNFFFYFTVNSFLQAFGHDFFCMI